MTTTTWTTRSAPTNLAQRDDGLRATPAGKRLLDEDRGRP